MKIKRIYQYNYYRAFILILGLCTFSWSCNISKHVPKDNFLIKNSEIKINYNDSSSTEAFLDYELLNDLIKQKPNRKLLSKFRIYLRLYNLSNQDRIEKKILIKEDKINFINSKIEIKNSNKLKKDSAFKIKPLRERVLTFGEKIQRAGEAPVVFDKLLTEKSKIQIKNYLFNKGYFSSSVRDSIVYHSKRQITTYFLISTGSSSKVNQINYKCLDQGITAYLDTIKNNSIIMQI